MLRVPQNPDAPTFDETFKVSFGRWLFSRKADRLEWARRRNLAAQAARVNQDARVKAFTDRKAAEVQQRRHRRDQ